MENHIFLHFAETEFKCPSCERPYNDEKYIKRCNNNKNWMTKINCKCDHPFWLTYNYKGDIIVFNNLRSV